MKCSKDRRKDGGIVTPELYDYLQSLALPEHPRLQALRRETQDRVRQSHFLISVEQSHFLGFLIRLLGAKNCLDIGTFTGYSALLAALSIPPEGRVVSLDYKVDWEPMRQKHWKQAGVSDKITQMLAPALESLVSLQGQRFDFIFLDADKVNYGKYLQPCLALLDEKGVLVVDNLLLSGRILQNDNRTAPKLQEFNSSLQINKEIDFSILAIADGLALIRKK